MVDRQESARLPSIDLCLVTYANPRRAAGALAALAAHDPAWLAQVRVVEDYSTDELHGAYHELTKSVGCPLTRRPTWGGLQGTGQFALETSTAEWFIYWTDDAWPTPGSFTWLARWCAVLPAWVGALQIPYWNFCELPADVPKPATRDMTLLRDVAWLADLPWNPHWWGPAFYLNLSGAGFVVRRAAWEALGGFNPLTWSLDEDLSCKCWYSDRWTIASVPGPPLIHQGGASTPEQHAHGHAENRSATIDGWLDAWHKPKDQTAAECRAQMRRWQERTGWIAR